MIFQYTIWQSTLDQLSLLENIAHCHRAAGAVRSRLRGQGLVETTIKPPLNHLQMDGLPMKS